MADRSSEHPTGHDPQAVAPAIRAVRAQVEAARLRHEALVASGRFAESAAQATPTKTIPGYTLVRELHRGGQGVVFVAVQQSTNRQVAVKVLRAGPAGSNPESARFEREVEVLSRLKHPNIVTIHDCGRAGDELYLVMDYVVGRPVDSAAGGGSVRDVLALFAKICDGVGAAHLRGVIHRDLKPGNILVDEDVEPRVLDFGLAKVVPGVDDPASASVMTVAGEFVGSLPWASPEQAEGRADLLDIRTDVYSLGVVLYQLLTGSFPYPVIGRMDELVRHIVHTNPARPGSLRREIPRDVDLIVLKCLMKEPARRYQSAGELARDVRRYLSGEPIEARPASTRYQLRHFARRHKALVGAVSAVFIILAGATGGMYWALRRAERATRETNAVNDFMEEILALADPDVSGPDVKFTEVLRKAADTAATRFAAHPEVEAEVHMILARAFRNLTLPADALEHVQREYGIRLAVLGPDHPATLQAGANRATALLDLNRFEEARLAAQDVVSHAPEELALSEPVICARCTITDVQFVMGETDAALEGLRAALSDARDGLGDHHLVTVSVARKLAECLRSRGSDRHSTDGERDLQEAAAILRALLELPAPSGAAERFDRLETQLKYAMVLRSLGRIDEADASARDVLKEAAAFRNADHLMCQTARQVLMRTSFARSDFSEAAEFLISNVEAARRAAGGKDSIWSLAEMSDGLVFLDAAGYVEVGAEYARILIEKFGGGRGHTLHFPQEYHVHRARFLSRDGRTDEAEELFRAVRERDPDITSDPFFQLAWGGHQAALGNLEDSERLLVLAEAALDARTRVMVLPWQELARLYDAWNKPAEAERWRRRLNESVRQLKPG